LENETAAAAASPDARATDMAIRRVDEDEADELACDAVE